MSPHRRWTVLATWLVLLALPATATAGDSPIFVVDDWGVGAIDNRIMIYAGKGHYIKTPIPAPPRGPRWDVVYGTAPWLAIAASAAVTIRSYRRRSGRGFEVQPRTAIPAKAAPDPSASALSVSAPRV